MAMKLTPLLLLLLAAGCGKREDADAWKTYSSATNHYYDIRVDRDFFNDNAPPYSIEGVSHWLRKGPVTNAKGDVLMLVTTNYSLESFVSSGEFCRIRGHVWIQHFHTEAVNLPAGECRKCGVCGLHQSRTLSEWR